MKTSYEYNQHKQAVKRTLPRLIFDLSLLFVLAQAGLAALNLAGREIVAHFKP